MRRTRDLQTGHTLIELMIVLVVLTVFATIAFGSYSANSFSGKYREFTDEIEGSMIIARNRAIDEQTTVRVELRPDGLVIFEEDAITKEWDELRAVTRELIGPEKLQDGETPLACIVDVIEGVRPPSQADEELEGFAETCLDGTVDIRFNPDGGIDAGNSTAITETGTDNFLDGLGYTVVIGDFSVSGQFKYTLVEIFPGGLIRKFEGITQEEEE